MSKQEGSAVYNIVAFVFADPNTAKEVSKELKHDAKGAGYKIIANAAVEVDAKGKAHIHEAGHGTLGRGPGRGWRWPAEPDRRPRGPAGLGRGRRRRGWLRRQDRRPRHPQEGPGGAGREDAAQHLGHPGHRRGQGVRGPDRQHEGLQGPGGHDDGGRRGLRRDRPGRRSRRSRFQRMQAQLRLQLRRSGCPALRLLRRPQTPRNRPKREPVDFALSNRVPAGCDRFAWRAA